MYIVKIMNIHKMYALQPFEGSTAQRLTKLYLTQQNLSR